MCLSAACVLNRESNKHRTPRDTRRDEDDGAIIFGRGSFGGLPLSSFRGVQPASRKFKDKVGAAVER